VGDGLGDGLGLGAAAHSIFTMVNAVQPIVKQLPTYKILITSMKQLSAAGHSFTLMLVRSYELAHTHNKKKL
jgi:hypothetical protein